MKEVKKFLSDYNEDFNPNVNLDKIKSQITFKNNSKIIEKIRFFDLKLVLTVLVTILIVIPTTILITRIYSPTYSDDPNRNIFLYLDKNFDSFLSSPIESELLDEAIISFYLGRKNNDFYVISFLETKNDYIPHFKTTPPQLITTINSSISTIKVDNINLLTIEVIIEYKDKTITSNTYLLELDNFKHLIQ